MDDREQPQPDETILGGESAVPGTAGSAAGGADDDDAGATPPDDGAGQNKPPER